MTGPVEWQTLLLIVSAIVGSFFFAITILSFILKWIYSTFVVHQKTSEELRKEISALRAEAAQTYVTIVAHKLIKETIDRRSDHMESAIDRLSATVDRMSDKQDKAIGELVSALSARFAQT